MLMVKDEVNLREIKLKWKNKEKFSVKQDWPDHLEGSYVTYGWVLIFSPSPLPPFTYMMNMFI